jgi:N6-L-threonylcarbamoyladenine synthase
MCKILAIETSCDETAAAVIENGTRIRSNIVASQIELHRRYGGVYPELASRQHILVINTVVREAMITARTGWNELQAVAVTYGPGLVGSLLVGVNTAKGLALSLGLPLIGVNHLEGHIYSNWLDTNQEGHPPAIKFPSLALIVSGGHTELVLIRGHGDYEIVGRTLDDAAGEAFDKVARMIGLGYPGGPVIQEAAQTGDPGAYHFPRALPGRSFDFSFSGLKTAVLRVLDRYKGEGAEALPATAPVANIAAAFQMAVVDVLVHKTIAAAQAYAVAEILLAGGVAANSLLRHKMMTATTLPVRVPPLSLCTDNAAMIGAAAYWRLQAGQVAGWELDVVANLRLV